MFLFKEAINSVKSTEGRLTISHNAFTGTKRFIYESAYQAQLSGALEYHCHMTQRNEGLSGSESW